MKTYFVSYNYKDGDVLGFGNTEITLKGGIVEFQDIREIEKIIKGETSHESVFINNYIKLKKVSK